MLKILLAAMLSLGLAACQAGQMSNTQGAVLSAAVGAALARNQDNKIVVSTSKIIKAVDRLGCPYVPEAETVVNIIAAGDGTVQTLEAAVEIICRSVGVVASYVADDGKKKHRRGTVIRSVAIVNGKQVPVVVRAR